MTIMTRDFGEITIDKSQIISFPEGLYAFEDEKEFVLLSHPEAAVPAHWLQSVKTSQLCFIVFEAQSVIPDYAPIYSDKELSAIDSSEKSPLEYYFISVIHDDFQKSTINVKSPVVYNRESNKAKQIIVDNNNYLIKHPLFAKESGEVR